jgi:hypothetical protein
VRWRFEVDPHLLFLGVFWKDDGLTFDVYICIIPMLPLRLQWGQDWNW